MTAYARWLNGLCPCCVGDLAEWIDGTPPEAIAEGVQVCGRCVAMDHMRDGLREAMLEAIARRTDEPIDTLIP